MVITRSQTSGLEQDKSRETLRDVLRSKKVQTDATSINDQMPKKKQAGRKRVTFHPSRRYSRLKAAQKVKQGLLRTVSSAFGYRPLLSKGTDIITNKERVRLLIRLAQTRRIYRHHCKPYAIRELSRPFIPLFATQEAKKFLMDLNIPVLPPQSTKWSLQR
jgi:hypothetical protein